MGKIIKKQKIIMPSLHRALGLQSSITSYVLQIEFGIWNLFFVIDQHYSSLKLKHDKEFYLGASDSEDQTFSLQNENYWFPMMD